MFEIGIGSKVKRVRGHTIGQMVLGNTYTVSDKLGDEIQVEGIPEKWYLTEYFELANPTKFIKITWVKTNNFGYDMEMRVVESNHERFIVGSRFDYGFFNVATREGYTILSEPSPEIIKGN